MMNVVSAQEMREWDRRAAVEFAMPGVVLMENAGRAVVDAVHQEFGALAGMRVLVFCGPGNNGGDGFVISRYLALAGARCRAIFAGTANALRPDARVHHDIARNIGIPFLSSEPVGVQSAIESGIDLIVDALLGTGVREAPRPEIANLIEIMNGAGCPVVAVDLPSGVDADTGAVPGAAVRAACTVTFGLPKLGLLLHPGAELVGRLRVADIGFDWSKLAPSAQPPETAAVQFAIDYPAHAGRSWRSRERTDRDPRQIIDFGLANRLLRPRTGESNKGDYGHVGIIAGSRGMAGAPALVARGAQRVGAGLVTVLSPESVQPAIGAKLDEQMTLALPEKDGALAAAAFAAIARFAEKITVLCLGPGLTTAPEAAAVALRVIAEIAKPLILDADGLNALAASPETALMRREDPRAPLILTPHPGEAARLLGTSIADVQSNRLESARELARRCRAVVVLKGRHSLIVDSDGRVIVNTSGNPGMASGGMGDTLTGILGGLLAQAVAPLRATTDDTAYAAEAIPPLQVAALGVFLHGTAGDLAAARMGEAGMAAGDLIDDLPSARRLLEETL